LLKAVVGIVLLLAIALIGYRKTFTRLRLLRGAGYVFLTGTEFILVGVALGGALLGILDDGTLRSLTPLFTLGLGFIGLIFGIQLDIKKIIRFPVRYSLIAFIQAVVTLAVVFAPSYLLMHRVFDAPDDTILLGSLVLAATASCTGLTTTALLNRELRLKNSPSVELLRYVSGLDAVVALVAIGFTFCLMHPHSPFGGRGGSSVLWFALSLGIGMSMGFLLHLLTRIRCSEEELLIFVLGMVLFSGGLAQYFRLSPLFICMILGITMANLPGARDRVFAVLAGLEHPFYIVLLILAGAIWRVGTPWAWIFAALYLCLRTGGKLLGAYLALRAAAGELRAPRRMGLGLVSQGGIAVAIVINYQQVFPTDLSGVVVTSVLTAVIINELISPTLTKNVLVRAGEIEG